MPEMTEDEVWEGLEELWEDELIEHVPALGDVDDHHFTLTDDGTRYAEQLLRESDDAVLLLVATAVDNVDRPGDSSAIASALVDIGKIIRDNAGVNIFRVMRRNPEQCPGLDVAELDEEFVAAFDPSEEDESDAE